VRREEDRGAFEKNKAPRWLIDGFEISKGDI